ncbi:DUF6478 family protein [Sulfitobacter geojensis]|jgi:hypothetical protein|uniref:Uncharacterized protein n=1 Tax=Sulfitobacter geojensis TaxID=1342299 RepID=A0AAE2VY98_9RHOB|nr:DUF6478 family protein [Sulfitobacter geojensis]KHA50665.1 hypothetical protein Z947_934 [Sulfitobacter geojensis]MBM1689678.1 hypothetical protein [Sulfitobacter geojensis]MBM1693744.1 hypothetical protein [Sulfitobacter geojensis]MBM1705910.1 hypothetical protein [Sulfitobacter geojensis]MBM1709968.1 hypothetical protein [Sulfitobacter geojensis]
MSKISFSFLDGKVFSRNMLRWARAARRAPETELPLLRRQRARARALKTHLDKLIHTADERLALPMIGSTSFPKPHNADWAWRPELWRGPLPTPGLSAVQTKSMLGDEVTLFHDCEFSELTLRQLRNLREADLAPYGLRLDVFQFDGSFLSLVVDLPEDGTNGLKRTHLLRMDAIVEMEKPLEIFARLNIKHGPNTEQIVRELPLNEENHRVEFDLAYSNLNEKRVERAWIDLIFEGPQMNQVVLRDLTFSRRPRAHL